MLLILIFSENLILYNFCNEFEIKSSQCKVAKIWGTKNFVQVRTLNPKKKPCFNKYFFMIVVHFSQNIEGMFA